MDTKVIDLVRKLIAMQVSAASIGSMEEAKAFAAKAQSLMDEHKIGMSDVEYAQREVEEPVGYSDYSGPEAYSGGAGKRQLWTRNLGDAIASANECEIVLGHGNRLCFVGRTSSREFCIMMFQYMYTLAADMADKAVQVNKDAQYKEFRTWVADTWYDGDLKAGFRHWIKNYRKSWLNGFSDAITARLHVQTQERNLKANPGAMVHINKDLQAVEEFMDSQKFNKVRIGGNRGSNSEAYSAGKKTGGSVALTPHTFSGGSRASSSRLLPA